MCVLSRAGVEFPDLEPIGVLDLSRDPLGISEEVEQALTSVWRRRRFVGGEEHTRLREELAARLGRPVTLLSSGTAALELGLEALGLQRGEVVLVPAFTFAATGSAVVRAGGVPRFLDVDPDTGCLDPAEVEEFLGRCPDQDGAPHDPTTGTPIRGVVPVSLYGRPLDPEPWLGLERRGLFVLEDAAQSLGAGEGARAAGSWGDAAAFSTYPTKNLGGPGEGGFVAASEEVAARVGLIADQGQSQKYEHAIVGTNARLNNLVAAALLVALPHLDRLNTMRRALAARHRSALEGVLALPSDEPGHIYHQFVVRHPERDAFAERLAARGVGTAVHYPRTLPSQPAFAACPTEPTPVADRWAAEALSLPCFPGMTDEEADRVAAACREAA